MENGVFMRTLLITYDFPPIVSGIGTVFYNVWQYLSPHDHLILAPKVKGYEKVDKAGGLLIYRYLAFSRYRILRMIVILFYSFYLIIREKISVVICGAPFTTGLVGLILKKVMKIPYCVFYYGGEYGKFKSRKIQFRLLEKILQNASIVITNSEYTSKDVRRFRI
ncbi:MAG: glycosyltransferase, partial [Deltaproteobacteria bacterium]|nr:glycosyltransferase [Deltaproteobacteria bacterium]